MDGRQSVANQLPSKAVGLDTVRGLPVCPALAEKAGKSVSR